MTIVSQYNKVDEIEADIKCNDYIYPAVCILNTNIYSNHTRQTFNIFVRKL